MVLIPYPHVTPSVPEGRIRRLPTWWHPRVVAGGATLFLGIGTAAGLLYTGGAGAGAGAGDASSGFGSRGLRPTTSIHAGMIASSTPAAVGAADTAGTPAAEDHDRPVPAAVGGGADSVPAVSPPSGTSEVLDLSIFTAVFERAAEAKAADARAGEALATRAEATEKAPPTRTSVRARGGASRQSTARPIPPLPQQPAVTAPAPIVPRRAPAAATNAPVSRTPEPSPASGPAPRRPPRVATAPVNRAAIRAEVIAGARHLVELINQDGGVGSLLLDARTYAELSRFMETEMPVASFGTVYDVIVDGLTATADFTVGFEWRESSGVRNQQTGRFQAVISQAPDERRWQFTGVRLVSGLP